jgi:hypothetical protein
MSPVSPRRHQSRHQSEVVVALVCHQCHQYVCIRAHIYKVLSLYTTVEEPLFYWGQLVTGDKERILIRSQGKTLVLLVQEG